MLHFMRSLKDLQNQRLETSEEFATFLGISPQTYRRLLRGDAGIQNPTRRKIDGEKESRIVKLVFYLGLEIANAKDKPKWNPKSYQEIVGQ